MATYFIADLHISPPLTGNGKVEEQLSRFEQFCDRIAGDMDDLYILGDLFEVWIGDDAGVPAYKRVLKALSQLPGRISVLHGNRDFLLSEAFSRVTGGQLLPDPSVIEVGGQKILIAHGDALCTDDDEYQQVRCLVRGEEWKKQFLGQSIEQRLAQASGFRDQSRETNASKSAEIMDVNPESVTRLLEEFGLQTLVHGHTHRPAQHTHQTRYGTATRWVLGSWQQTAEILRWGHQGPALLPLDVFLSG